MGLFRKLFIDPPEAPVAEPEAPKAKPPKERRPEPTRAAAKEDKE